MIHVMIQRVHLLLASAWSVIRTLATDDAYDKYLAHHAEAHACAPPLSRRAFYLNQQQCKWTGVSRCC
jgi:uncharacterized short protein YbdD (DUF466 family)